MIRLPKKHIADSVAERILAAEQKLNSVQMQGQRLDQALATPPAMNAEPIEGLEDAVVTRALGL